MPLEPKAMALSSEKATASPVLVIAELQSPRRKGYTPIFESEAFSNLDTEVAPLRPTLSKCL